MQRFILSVFLVLHGGVHLLYAGQSRRLFELQPEMTWPDGAWALSRLLGDGATRGLAAVTYTLAALGFAGGGVALLARQAWWRPLAAGAAALSTALILLFWDGRWRKLADQGALALLINVALLVALPALG
jgi:hypothetical protein